MMVGQTMVANNVEPCPAAGAGEDGGPRHATCILFRHERQPS
jgi:hypothetical protein